MDDQRAFGQLEGRFDGMDQRLSSIEEKMDQLLTWRYKVYGMSIMFGILSSAVFEFILVFFFHKS